MSESQLHVKVKTDSGLELLLSPCLGGRSTKGVDGVAGRHPRQPCQGKTTFPYERSKAETAAGVSVWVAKLAGCAMLEALELDYAWEDTLVG